MSEPHDELLADLRRQLEEDRMELEPIERQLKFGMHPARQREILIRLRARLWHRRDLLGELIERFERLTPPPD